MFERLQIKENQQEQFWPTFKSLIQSFIKHTKMARLIPCSEKQLSISQTQGQVNPVNSSFIDYH